MSMKDSLGPRENQSPSYKNRPTTGGNPKLSESELEENCVGGNKHTATGGGSDENMGSDAATKSARGNYGIDNSGPRNENFEE